MTTPKATYKPPPVMVGTIVLEVSLEGARYVSEMIQDVLNFATGTPGVHQLAAYHAAIARWGRLAHDLRAIQAALIEARANA